MKQHITPEQLNKLSDEAKEKLREWWGMAWNDYRAAILAFYPWMDASHKPGHFKRLQWS